MELHPLAHLLTPSSVAVVGASEDPASVGAALVRNLARSFAGTLWLVNPNRRQVHGRPAHRSISALPSVPELAVLATPPETIPGLIDECARQGVRAAAILSSGLSTATREGRRALQQISA